jgi:hypothetical protein
MDALDGWPGWHGVRGSSPTGGGGGKAKNPKPDPPVKPGSPKPIPKPSPLPGSPPVVVNPSPPVTDHPTPVNSNPSPTPDPGTILDPAPRPPSPSKPNPNPGNPGRQPDKPTPEPPVNPGSKPTPNPTPQPYNPKDPTPPPQDPLTKLNGNVDKIFDRDGSLLWDRYGSSPESRQRADKKLEGYLTEYYQKQEDNGKRAFPIIGILSPPINKPDPIPELKKTTPVNRNTGEVIKPKPDPQPAKEEPKVGTPGGGGSTCQWPADRGIVIGNQETIKTSEAQQNVILEAIVNTHIKSVSDKVTGAKELLDKIVRSDVVDRAINLLTLASAIHNSVMLSRELGSTLTEALSNILSAVGIKDANGQAFDLNAVFGQQLESFVKSIVGTENYGTYKEVWIKANRILTTADNLLNAVRAEHSAIMQGVEVVANVTSELSNASKLEGLFNDDLLDFQPTHHDFKTPLGKTQLFLQNLNEAGEQINQLASSVIEGQEAKTEIEKNWDEFGKAIADAKKVKKDVETEKDTQNIPSDTTLLDFVRYQAED